MEVTARLSYLHIAPRKVRLVAGLIRGRRVADALNELRHLPKRATAPIEKLLRSAVANAKHNFQLDDKNLRVKSVVVDGGPVSRRFRARAFGRAAPLRRRTSHVILVLDELVPTSQKSRKLKKTAQPIIREASADSLKELSAKFEPGTPRSEERKTAAKAKPASQSGFVRRIFNRKAV